MTKSYCTQNNFNCGECSLVNYNMDCHNNPIAKTGNCDNCGENAQDYHCGDYINTAPLSAAEKAKFSEMHTTAAACQPSVINFFSA